MSCQHSKYWTTISGNCMACRAENSDTALRDAARLLNGCLLDRNMPIAQRDEIVLWLKNHGVKQ